MAEPVEQLLPLTPVVFHTLICLAEGASHGYAIAQEVERVTAGAVKMGPGTLYGTLHRLQELGLIREAEGPEDADGVHSDRRRYYALTPRGREVARSEMHRLESVMTVAREALRDAGGRV